MREVLKNIVTDNKRGKFMYRYLSVKYMQDNEINTEKKVTRRNKRSAAMLLAVNFIKTGNDNC